MIGLRNSKSLNDIPTRGDDGIDCDRDFLNAVAGEFKSEMFVVITDGDVAAAAVLGRIGVAAVLGRGGRSFGGLGGGCCCGSTLRTNESGFTSGIGGTMIGERETRMKRGVFDPSGDVASLSTSSIFLQAATFRSINDSILSNICVLNLQHVRGKACNASVSLSTPSKSASAAPCAKVLIGCIQMSGAQVAIASSASAATSHSPFSADNTSISSLFNCSQTKECASRRDFFTGVSHVRQTISSSGGGDGEAVLRAIPFKLLTGSGGGAKDDGSAIEEEGKSIGCCC